MFREMAKQRIDFEMLRTAVSNSMSEGPVAKLDAQKGYRIELGMGDDGPILSPWYPHPENSKTSVPLRVGQNVGVFHPTGDPMQGFMMATGYSDKQKSPNDDVLANVFEDAGVRLVVKDGSLTITIGGVTFVLSGNGLAITGGMVTHNGQNIGSTHKHGGIVRGIELTFVPQ